MPSCKKIPVELQVVWLHKFKEEDISGGGGGGGGSPFTVHEKYNIGISRFTENKRERFGKSRFTATMEITIHEEKITMTGNKNGRSRVTKIPFTTLKEFI